MGSTLPSYEAAMRDAREYLRRRDLTSQDEIPLYFAWERLYAAANANLSTDFLNESRAELRARQQARLTPRQGLPPPLFTSFDKVNRKSLQTSAFLRSGLSSDAAIEMMARRYRREAEKLRSSREKLVAGSLGGAGERLKKGKRGKKTPQQEVDELLEALESPGSPMGSDFATSTLSKDRLGAGSDDGGKRAKKINRNLPNPEQEVEALLAKFENSNTVRNRVNAVKPKGEVDFSGGKDSFAGELAGGDAAKAAELRRSSFSMGNPAADPSVLNVEDVTAFAAQVSDWRMHPTADTAALPPKLGHNGLASNGLAPTTKGTKRVNGGGKTRKSGVVGGGEGDTTFDTSLGSSGSDEDHFDTNGSLRSSAVTSRRSTAHTSDWVDDVDENEQLGDEQEVVRNSAMNEMLQDQPTVGGASNSTTLNARPRQHATISTSGAEWGSVQLSHAVGNMQVKIKGKEIEVTFRGSLDNSNSDESSNTEQQSERINPRGQPSATQKVFGTIDATSSRGGGEDDEHETADPPAQMRNAVDQSDVNLLRKQSSVRFSGVADDDVDEGTSDDVSPSQNEPKPLEARDAPVASLPRRQELPPHHSRTAGTDSSAASQDDLDEGSLYNNGEAVELDARSNMKKPHRQQVDVHDARLHDNGNSRASTSRSDHQNPTAGGRNGVLQEESQGRHHIDSDSRIKQVLVEDSDSGSDEDFSDGPDTPDLEYRHHKSKHESSQLQRRAPHDTREYADHGRSRRPSSRPPSSQHASSRNKQRSHSTDSSSDSSSGYDSRIEVEKPDQRHRSDTVERPRSKHSSTRDRQRPSTRYSSIALRDRDHHLAAAMESPPKRIKPEIRSKETKQTKTKHDSKSSKSTPKLRIVWPPGMEAECIARLGLDGHHPIAPPGLEHLVTDEQWGDYWTWLHWYSSWQMWYMKNGKKPKGKSDKEKRRGRRHTESDESLDTEAGRYDNKSQRNNNNANWWVDVGSTKRQSRRQSRS